MCNKRCHKLLQRHEGKILTTVNCLSNVHAVFISLEALLIFFLTTLTLSDIFTAISKVTFPPIFIVTVKQGSSVWRYARQTCIITLKIKII